MKVLLVLIMSIVAVVSAGSCPTMKIYGQPNCLPKSEYHPYWQRTLTFTSANGPCFKKGSGQPVSPTNLFFLELSCWWRGNSFIGTQMCFINKSWVNIPCECSDSACGCTASYAPQCSGTQVHSFLAKHTVSPVMLSLSKNSLLQPTNVGSQCGKHVCGQSVDAEVPKITYTAQSFFM